jgi:hypothetical protein
VRTIWFRILVREMPLVRSTIHALKSFARLRVILSAAKGKGRDEEVQRALALYPAARSRAVQAGGLISLLLGKPASVRVSQHRRTAPRIRETWLSLVLPFGISRLIL